MRPANSQHTKRFSAPTTREELRNPLDQLALNSYENGVEVDNGGYPLNHDDSEISNWDIHITSVEKPVEIE